MTFIGAHQFTSSTRVPVAVPIHARKRLLAFVFRSRQTRHGARGEGSGGACWFSLRVSDRHRTRDARSAAPGEAAAHDPTRPGTRSHTRHPGLGGVRPRSSAIFSMSQIPRHENWKFIFTIIVHFARRSGACPLKVLLARPGPRPPLASARRALRSAASVWPGGRHRHDSRARRTTRPTFRSVHGLRTRLIHAARLWSPRANPLARRPPRAPG
jgi:hypothetical protein